MERSHAVFLSLQDRSPRPIAAPERAVLCLGNFDGVHVAHRALLRAGVRSARAGGCPCGVFCFYRPSSDYFPALPTPEAVYASGTHLCSLSEKLARFAEEGVDFVWLCSFSAVRDIPAGDFPELLRTGCGCQGVVCGFNYRYGAGGAGTAAMLAAAFSCPSDVPPVVLPEMRLADGTVRGSPPCSRTVRTRLLAGGLRSGWQTSWASPRLSDCQSVFSCRAADTRTRRVCRTRIYAGRRLSGCFQCRRPTDGGRFCPPAPQL